jgi:hypothetical protein
MFFPLALALFVTSAASQQIFDIVSNAPPHQSRQALIPEQYQTTWSGNSLFKYTNLGTSPINFVTKGAIGDADIVITVSPPILDKYGL